MRYCLALMTEGCDQPQSVHSVEEDGRKRRSEVGRKRLSESRHLHECLYYHDQSNFAYFPSRV